MHDPNCKFFSFGGVKEDVSRSISSRRIASHSHLPKNIRFDVTLLLVYACKLENEARDLFSPMTSAIFVWKRAGWLLHKCVGWYWERKRKDLHAFSRLKKVLPFHASKCSWAPSLKIFFKQKQNHNMYAAALPGACRLFSKITKNIDQRRVVWVCTGSRRVRSRFLSWWRMYDTLYKYQSNLKDGMQKKKIEIQEKTLDCCILDACLPFFSFLKKGKSSFKQGGFDRERFYWGREKHTRDPGCHVDSCGLCPSSIRHSFGDVTLLAGLSEK